MNLSDVYDVAHAGPRNRFTIKTDTGHLVVHNCGYQGWLGAAKAFDIPGTDDEIKSDILAWRAASPAVEWFWGGQTTGKAASIVKNACAPGYAGTVAAEHRWRADGDRWSRDPLYFGVEGMAVRAVLHPGDWHVVTRLDGTDSGVAFRGHNGKLYCRLPNGRLLTYHSVRLDPSERGGMSISYMGWNSNAKNGPFGWIRMQTWGGRLVENIVQGTCRDILAPACVALEARGYPVVLHVYDEIVAEVPEGFGSNEEFEEIVTVPPWWARDWPIRAPGGWRAKRYRKG
jgi:DNA polymerase